MHGELTEVDRTTCGRMESSQNITRTQVKLMEVDRGSMAHQKVNEGLATTRKIAEGPANAQKVN